MDAAPARDPLDGIRPPPSPGERLVLRHRLPDGSATDTLGWLEGLDDDVVGLRDRHGARVDVARRDVVAARLLSPARGGRDPRRTGSDELEQIALPAWVAEREPLGQWTLRAGGGFTGRANSCLAVGDPGLPVAEAAQRIVEHAVGHGIRPLAQVVTDGPVDRALVALGWRPAHVATDVLTARLNDLLSVPPAHDVDVSPELTDAWLRVFRRSRPDPAPPAVVERVLRGDGRTGFAAGHGPSGDLVAVGRGHLNGDWLGLAAVWTEPEHRRRGWSVAVLHGLGRWAARQGARSVYLQVAAANTAAHEAYARSGFVRHHGYRYLTPGEGLVGQLPRDD